MNINEILSIENCLVSKTEKLYSTYTSFGEEFNLIFDKNLSDYYIKIILKALIEENEIIKIRLKKEDEFEEEINLFKKSHIIIISGSEKREFNLFSYVLFERKENKNRCSFIFDKFALEFIKMTFKKIT